MKSAYPVENLAASLYSACHKDLLPMLHPEIKFQRKVGEPGTQRVETGKTKKVRPTPYQCKVTMFSQLWGSTALGFGGIGGAAMTEAYTVVVEGPRGDACVYFGGHFAYHLKKPNPRFFEDVGKRCMLKVAEAKLYEASPRKAA